MAIHVLKSGVLALCLLVGAAGGCFAQKTVDLTEETLKVESRLLQLAEGESDGELDGGSNLAISPRQAGQIAKAQVPGSKVLKVTLLQGRTYAVTLRGNGELLRKLVDGVTGAVQ